MQAAGNAQANLDAAQRVLDGMDEGEALKNLDNAKKDVAIKQQVANEAARKLSEAQQALNKAKSTLDNAKNNAILAQQNADTKQTALNRLKLKRKLHLNNINTTQASIR